MSTITIAPSAATPAYKPASTVADRTRLRFGRSTAFQKELKLRVDAYFKESGQSPRDCWQMYLKSAILLSIFAALYAGLVFFGFHGGWPLALGLSVMLGLATAGIAFNIQHDGGHHGYSKSSMVNQFAAMTLDLVGGSSYIWDWKHDVLHHTYTNIIGHDTDIELGILGRLCPHQKRYWFHRFQHLYLWFFYGLLVPKWHFYDDFVNVITGSMNGTKFPRPKGRKLLMFLGGKAVFLGGTFAFPMWYGMHFGHYPWWAVLVCYGVASITLGMVLSVVFQLAHAVEHAEFPMPEGNPETIASAWAVHQVESTVDFGRGNPVLAWLLGGLNYQIEHHLMARVCHIHYPAISELVKKTCEDFGVTYREHTTFWSGVGSHYRWLREMGQAPRA